MTTLLHTVNKSPHTNMALADCLRFMLPGDALILLEDGVYAAVSGVDCGVTAAPGDVFVISADVTARGLAGRITEGVSVIDHSGFVQLCTEYDSVKNWS